ncbi:hypothetical protein CQJ94_11845 [Glycomyces fuscus]|nr:hypothetical protein CQJ94_11845 [Glycomyces fuscus]
MRYRRLIIGLSSRHAWKIDNDRLARMYASHVSANHLEVGPADGHFLSQAPDPVDASGGPVPAERRRIQLMDLNPGPLRMCEPKLAGRARVTSHVHDVLSAPWPVADASVDSVAMFHVLHCVPGNGIRAKATAFSEAARVLSPEQGVFFGATLPGAADGHTSNNWLARRLQHAYNQPERNIFHNRGDRVTDLRAVLEEHFTDVEVTVMGADALWVARGPRA